MTLSEEKKLYRQADATKILRKIIGRSTSRGTAIRGYKTYTKGYELDNNYWVAWIKFHGVSDAEVAQIKTELDKENISYNELTKNGLCLNQH